MVHSRDIPTEIQANRSCKGRHIYEAFRVIDCDRMFVYYQLSWRVIACNCRPKLQDTGLFSFSIELRYVGSRTLLLLYYGNTGLLFSLFLIPVWLQLAPRPRKLAVNFLRGIAPFERSEYFYFLTLSRKLLSKIVVCS